MTRERFLSTSAIAATLGSGVAAVLLGIGLLESLLPVYTFNLPIFLLGFSILIIMLVGGMVLGAVMWVLVLRRWYNRDELAAHFTQPDIVLISPFLSWLFERLYR